MKIFKLKDISEFIRNGVTIKQNISSKEGIPITRIETISKGIIDFDKLGYADIFEFEKYKDWLLKKGDILISHINSEKHLGKSAIFLDNDVSIIHGMNLLCIRVIDDIVFPEYLQLFFKTNQYKRQIKKIMKKSVNQASFSVNDFKEILIRLPKLDIQEKIIKKIMTLEKILENNKLKLKFLSELNKSLFATMFGDIKTNDKNWELFEIKEISNILTRGKTPKYTLSSNVFVINQACIYWDKIKYENIKFHVEDENLLFLKNKDILINSTGTGTLGRMNIIQNIINEKFTIDSHVMLIRLKEEKILSLYFINIFMNEKYQKDLILKCVNGSTNQIELSKEKFSKFKIPIPPIELQNKFAERIEKIEKLKFTIMTIILNTYETMKKKGVEKD